MHPLVRLTVLRYCIMCFDLNFEISIALGDSLSSSVFSSLALFVRENLFVVGTTKES